MDLGGEYQRRGVSFLSHRIRAHISILLIPGSVNFDHLVIKCCPVSPLQLPFFSFYAVFLRSKLLNLAHIQKEN